ncbi:hypothetical protein [Jiangella alba]|uniref:hypothetical protein n=1 Tax=Jiangella alba TaxID=561176 RepID=UPI00114D00F3|nr:hypothetical protein [Jiangella alba]
MPSPGRGLPRLVRGAVLATFCLLMSMGAHVAAGGSPPLSPGLLLCAGLLVVSCVAAADRRRGFGGIVTVAGVSQVVFHLLSAGGDHGGSAAVVTPGPGMVLAHVVATLVVGAALACGERLVWSLAALCGVVRALRLVRCCPPPGPAPAAAAFAAPRPVRRWILARSGPAWRGPPVLSH